jgi:hypothetical protein
MKENKINICYYGCGLEAKFLFKNNRWCCSNHYSKCKEVRRKTGLKSTGRKIYSEEWKENQRIYMLNGGAKYINSFPTDPEIEKNKIEKQRQWMLNGGARYVASFVTLESREKYRKYMKNGGAVYAQSFIKNPSKPQVELYNRVKELYPSAELNYPCYRKGKNSYSLDVAIPELKIWFESDGLYWHPSEEKDLIRQKEIEELGWKVIRYKADSIKQVPCREKILKDICNLKIS